MEKRINEFSPVRRFKRELVQNTEALNALAQGNVEPAVRIISLGDMPVADLRKGLVVRLERQLTTFVSQSPRVPRAVVQAAMDAYKAATGRDFSPNYLA